MISQITPDGLSPARRETSTAASVWPARTSTPPGRATSGKTWPGETMASALLALSIATAMVRARSAAEMPVVTPSRASIETVKAVSMLVRLTLRHRLQPERVDALLAEREADQPAAVARHEVDRVGRRHLRGDDEVAFILAVVVVDEDVHPPVTRLVDDRLGADEDVLDPAIEQLLEPAKRVGGRVPVGAAKLAQGIGVEPGGAREARARSLAGFDERCDSFNEIGRHSSGDITLRCDHQHEKLLLKRR